MIKNILTVLIFLFCSSFFYLVISTYYSNSHKIKKNRDLTLQRINNNMHELPVLLNDTNNVIEFNSGFKKKNNKIKRNFWKLFKK